MNTGTSTQRVKLPEAGRFFVTDAGLETELVFLDEWDLPEFCAATLLETPEGRNRLRRYFSDFIELAKRHACGIVLETPTWRLNPDWAEKLGYSGTDRRRLNFAAVHLMQDMRLAASLPEDQFVVSGNLGPRFDGYKADRVMTPQEAAAYHGDQVETLRDAGVDCITAMTITNSNEAAGIAIAAREAGMPAVVSFTVETDGRLPSEETMREAIEAVEKYAPEAVSYFGINCAHPTHFHEALQAEEEWLSRIGFIRANASTMSHAELDNCSELDAGDPGDLAERYRQLKALLPGLRVFGGCCGTDVRHVSHICETCCQ
ncbi:MAG: homocysteine S-methyltransferase family protein [Rubinisphaera brasiliensis]|uniref:homocysteine S-methyltransferase family protein n=1 Tax=Rubinisphaera brasiliensis TaxID=119 RepID=UPI00391B6FFD